MDLFDTIAARRSVRSFDGKPLSSSQISDIKRSISQASSPFDGNYTIRLAEVGDGCEFRPSTYGVIKGARTYLLLGLDENPHSWLSGGFALEQVVLDITAMGIGSCWVSGTFSSSSFEAAANLPKGQKLVAVVPIGIPATKKSFVEKVMRTFAKCGTRKPFGSMFFMNNFSTPLPDDGPFVRPLDMMRWAPSAVNAQPWRALVRGNQVDFYYQGSGNAKLLDMGIGLCHFALACEAMNAEGAFVHNNMPVPGPEGTSYLISFIEV